MMRASGRVGVQAKSGRALATTPRRNFRTSASAQDSSSATRHADPVSAAGTNRRSFMAAVLALTACTMQTASAVAEEGSSSLAAASSSASMPETVYFGNGCFWGRQKDFAEVELRTLGRPKQEVSALVGYAGGAQAGPGGKVCYYYSDPRTVYERLGHAETVQVNISSDPGSARREFRAFADTYFKQFVRTPFGMSRSDPQDAGPGYRNVVGIPGGVNSPFFQILKEANVNGMELRAGRGGQWREGDEFSEDDLFNVVWVVDSNQLPFYRAEKYHQFHQGIGKKFPMEYLRDLKNVVANTGRIDPTGCPELPF